MLTPKLQAEPNHCNPEMLEGSARVMPLIKEQSAVAVMGPRIFGF